MKGLVIGKFYPPHLGHSYLIDYALAHSDTVDVLICDSPKYVIPARQRQLWLQAIHPTANVRIIPDLDDDDNSQAWADHTRAFLGYSPDIVFSSENYGEPYATFMNADHHMVDHTRLHIPISATRVRNYIIREWQYLHPIVKADLAIRVVVIGAESTGTTTLARDIAKKLHAPWVPEYGRLYSEGLLSANHKWNNEDFVHIAATQQRIEKRIASQSNGIIVCDTNASATQLWQKRYLHTTSKRVHEIAMHDKVNFYVITGDEIPFVQDGTRDGEHIRHAMHQDFITHVKKSGVPYLIVTGSKVSRLKQTMSAINRLLNHAAIIKDPKTATIVGPVVVRRSRPEPIALVR